MKKPAIAFTGLLACSVVFAENVEGVDEMICAAGQAQICLARLFAVVGEDVGQHLLEAKLNCGREIFVFLLELVTRVGRAAGAGAGDRAGLSTYGRTVCNCISRGANNICNDDIIAQKEKTKLPICYTDYKYSCGITS